MKKLVVAVSAFAALVLTSCGPNMNDAIKYNDQFADIQKALIPVQDAFIDQADGHNIDSLKLTYNALVEKAKSSVDACDKIKPFNKKSDYLDAAKEFFSTMNSLVDNEAKQIVNILCKDSASRTEDDVATVSKCAARFQSEYQRTLQKAQDAQAVFAKEWKFEVKESK